MTESLRISLTALVIAAAGCMNSPEVTDDRPVVSFTCGQTVVVGRIETLSETPICDDTGICWNSAKTAELHVKRALVGSRKAATLKVRYGGHGTLRGDADFMFVLQPSSDSTTYTLQGATLMETQPRLASSCDPSTAADAGNAR